MTSKKFLTKLLTTTSIIGTILGSAGLVSAADVDVGAGVINSNALVGGGSWGDGSGNGNDVINFDNAGGSVFFNQNNAVVQGIRTTTAGAPTAITVSNNQTVTIGSISDAQTLNKIVVNGANTVLNLSGTNIGGNANDYSKLGVVELSNNSSINVRMTDGTSETKFKVAKIYGTGTLNVTGNSGAGSKQISFGYSVGKDGGDNATALTINANAGDNDNGDIVFRYIDSTAPVTLRANTNKGDIRVNDTTAAGTLNLISGDGVKGQAVDGGEVTLMKAVTSGGDINITTGSGGAVDANVSGSGGKVTFGRAVNAVGNINITSGTGGDGTAGKQGKVGGVYFNDHVTAQNLHFISDAITTLDADKNINANITAAIDEVGVLIVEDGNSTITGDIGDVNNALSFLQFNGAGANTLTLTGNVKNLDTLGITADGIVTINNNANIRAVQFYNQDSTFKFIADVTLTGSVDATADGNGINGIIDASSSSATVTGDIGTSANAIADILIGDSTGNAQTFTARGNVHAQNITLAHANSELQVGGGTDVTITITNSIDGANADEGILTVQGTHGVNVTGQVGDGQQLQAINLKNTGSSAITFEDVVKTQSLVFDNTHTAPVTFDGVTKVTNSVNFTRDHQSLAFGGDVTLTGGADFNGLDGTITIKKADALSANVINNTTGGLAAKNFQGTLALEDKQTLGYNIGTDAANALKEVRITAGKEITLGAHTIFAQNITNGTLNLDDANSGLTAIANSKGTITSNIKFGANAAKFTIPDDTIDFKGHITADRNDNGIFEVSGNREFTGSIGSHTKKIAQLDLKAPGAGGNSTFTFKHTDVYANVIDVSDGSKFVIDTPQVNFGKIKAKDLALEVGTNTAVLTNGAVLEGDVSLGVSVAGNSAGSLDVRAGNLDLSGANTVVVNVTEVGAPTTNVLLQVLKTSGGRITKGPIPTVENKSRPTIQWTYQNKDSLGDTGSIILKSAYIPAVAQGIAEKATNPSLIPDTPDIIDKENTTLPDVLQVTDIMGAVQIGAPEQADKVAHQLKPKPGASTVATTAATGATKSVLATRINAVAPTASISVGAATDLEGVASGDEVSSTKLGAWAVGFGSRGVQKKHNDQQGYKSRVYGGSIGLDAALSEQAVLGVALTYADVSITHSDLNEGDKTKAPTVIGSIYGLYNFGNNWFTKGVISYGDSKITHKDQRPTVFDPLTGVINYSVATAKFHSKIITTEFGGGYRYSINNTCTFTPSLVVQYSNTKDGGYTETGVSVPQTIDKKTEHRWSSILGGELSSRHNIDNKVIIPEVHAYIDHKFSGKNPKTVSRFSGSAEALVGKYEPSKTTYNVGTGIKVSGGAVEYGIRYDATIAKKYLGHQGSIKVRVNL
jgi:outer membrane autotransporter protein